MIKFPPVRSIPGVAIVVICFMIVFLALLVLPSVEALIAAFMVPVVLAARLGVRAGLLGAAFAIGLQSAALWATRGMVLPDGGAGQLLTVWGLFFVCGASCGMFGSYLSSINRRTEDLERRVDEENAVLAEIGRIVNSSLDLDKVYESIAQQLHNLIPFDRISIATADLEAEALLPAYVAGIEIPGWRTRDVPLSGSSSRTTIETKKPRFIGSGPGGESRVRSLEEQLAYKAGLRSGISVPIVFNEQVVGDFILRSTNPDAYSQRELLLAERVSAQIAGAITNAQLHGHLQHEADEREVLVEVGRIIGSTLNIEEVYERFSEQVRKIMPFDRMTICAVDMDRGTFRDLYRVGLDVLERRVGAEIPLAGSVTEEVCRLRSGLLIQGEAEEQLAQRYPGTIPGFQAGLRSFLSVPLMSKNDVTGVLHLRSTEPNAFSNDHLALAARIAVQIAGAIANAQLHSELDHEARERAVLAEISRVIDSSLDIAEVYKPFAEQVRKLIPVDRLGIAIPDLEGGFILSFITGIEVVNGKSGDPVSMEGTFAHEILLSRSVVLLQGISRKHLEDHLPGLLPNFDAGLRSFIGVPLTHHDDVIGVLQVRSKEANAYTDRHLAIAEKIGMQISGGIARSLLYAELRRAEEALRKSEERYRLLVELSPEPVWVHSDGKIVYANAATASLLGADHPEELLGRSALDFVHKDFREEANVRMQRLYDDALGTPLLETKAVKLDGGVRDIESMAAPMRHEGEPAALVVQRDITGRKQLQQQLVQAQKMETVGQLAGGVAHDFNNLLTPIMGYSEMLMRDLPPDDPIRDRLGEILRAAERGATVTRQLLTFSRRQMVRPKIVNLNDLIADVDRMLRRLIGEDIELVCLPARDLAMVRVDPGQMEQVLVNMVVNARDVMPRGGKLTIRTANLTVYEASGRRFADLPPRRYVRLSVADTGIGMAEEVKVHLFEPFFTTKAVGEGTGLGLSICYGIVTQSGGEIRVQSEPNQGTTFDIYLPCVEEASVEEVGTTYPDELPRGTETVLLVEDESSVRRLVAEVLSRQGYTVLEAVTGEDALRVAQEHHGEEIDLLLTDVVMPQMGGKELAERLWSRIPDIEVLFMSGYPGETVERHGVSDTAVHFLPKPFTPETVAKKVRETLSAP